jgi:signal transduction histidine kinase
MSCELKVETSLNHAQKTLFLRFVGILVVFLLVIELVIGVMLFYRLFGEENKLLSSMATEYQRIIEFDSADKFIHVIQSNPQRLLDNNIAIYWQPDIAASKPQYVGGVQWGGAPIIFDLHQTNKNWLEAVLLEPYISKKLTAVQGDFWMVLDISSRYSTVFFHWLNFLYALTVLAFIIAIMVWRLIHSALSPLFMLANRLDKASEWSLDAFSKEITPITEQPTSDLSVINQSVSKVVLRLENVIRSMDNTLDAVAHDLRTPLSRIQLAAEKGLLSQEAGEAKTIEMSNALVDCAESSNHASRMLTTLMKINDEVIGKQELKLELVNLGDLLVTVSSWYEEIADEKKISLQIVANEQVIIKTEPNKLIQILVNLIDNAFKYTANGGDIWLEAASNEKGTVFISVRDNGIGIATEQQQLIFKRLYRVDKSRNTPGYGLGLSLVKAMIDNLGGAVAVDSTIGEGSKFTISLNNHLMAKSPLK